MRPLHAADKSMRPRRTLEHRIIPSRRHIVVLVRHEDQASLVGLRSDLQPRYTANPLQCQFDSSD